MDSFLLQAGIYLAAAVVAVPLSARLGLGSVLGYLAAGLVIGPALGLVGSETETFQRVGEFGVVMMLFLIGLDLEPKALWNMRKRLIGMGGLQVVLTVLAIAGAMLAMGYRWEPSLATGIILALSSTAIVLQTLDEKNLMPSAGGRSAFSVLLTQDMAVVPALALLPLLGSTQNISVSADGSIQRIAAEAAHHGLFQGLPPWAVTLGTLGIIALVLLAGIYGARPVFRWIHKARLPEMFTALALLIVVGIAVLMESIGLSPALGTFMAGVVLANSEFRHELRSDIDPFKGLLLGLFFVTVGAGINIEAFLTEPLRIIGLTLGLIAVKGLVLHLIARAFSLKGQDRWLFTLSLAQAGEFGFVLIAFSLTQGVFGVALEQTLLLVIALSMLATPVLFMVYEALGRRLGTEPERPAERVGAQGPVIIAGVGRFGQVVNRLVNRSGFETVVLDNDLETIEVIRAFGIKAWFGDPSRPEMLAAAGLAKARVLVVAVDDRATAIRIVRQVRRERPDLHIVARAYDRVHVYQLFRAGADDIVREMFDSSLRAGRYVLENMGLTDYEAAEAEMAFYHHDRKMLRELAELWKPGLPLSRNPAYIARSREMEAELETALMSPGQNMEELPEQERPRRRFYRPKGDLSRRHGKAGSERN